MDPMVDLSLFQQSRVKDMPFLPGLISFELVSE